MFCAKTLGAWRVLAFLSERVPGFVGPGDWRECWQSKGLTCHKGQDFMGVAVVCLDGLKVRVTERYPDAFSLLLSNCRRDDLPFTDMGKVGEETCFGRNRI